jgi:DNA-binding CsgD family transcriptional regulator
VPRPNPHLDAVHDALTCGVVLLGDGGRLLEANRAAADMLRLTREQLLGGAPLGPDWHAVDEDGRPLPAGEPIASLARGAPRRFRFGVARAPDDPPAWIRGDSVPISLPEAPYRVACTLVAGAEREPAGVAAAHSELHASRRLERLQAHRGAAMAINASHDVRVTLDVVVRQAALHLGVNAAAVAVLDEVAGALEYVAGVGFRRPDSLRSRAEAGTVHLGRAAVEWRALGVEDVAGAAGGLGSKLASDEGFVAHVAVPLVARGRPAGILELFHRQQLQPDAEWSEFVETLAELAATAIDAHRMRVRLGPAEAPASPLSTIEEELLRLAAAGCSNRTIATRVFLSENTVKFHLRRIYRQLGVHTRTEAAVAATSRGWLRGERPLSASD